MIVFAYERYRGDNQYILYLRIRYTYLKLFVGKKHNYHLIV